MATNTAVKSNNWQKLDELFHAALEREGNERAVYVAEACDGDEGLRQELESILAHHDQAKSFIESPAYALEAKTIVDDESPAGEDSSPSLIGTTLGSYTVLKQLGRGGMGEVYLAFDKQLQSKVALKFLHADLTGDRRRVLRFKQEARAARALNHPNILTVFEIGEVDGRQYIATEFVEGENLHDLMKRKQLDVGEALDIAIQIASALSVAHAAGIVHRDIKPENVMVRPDGYIKIVDFGVAKLTERKAPNSAASTLINTEKGTAVGTIRYMSPEQLRVQDVDATTDIWSFGVVLYEMITGSFPFSGETVGDLIVSILSADPISLPAKAALPIELERIIKKALERQRASRYQTAIELLRDLREMKLRLDAGERFATYLDRRKRLAITGVIAAILLLLIIVGVKFEWRSSTTTIASNPVVTAPATTAERVLTYSLTVQKMRNGSPYDQPFQSYGDELFRNGWKFRLNFFADQAGFLYLFNEEPAKNGAIGLRVLYPDFAQGSEPLQMPVSQTLQTDWYVFDQDFGTDKLWVVWAANALPDAETVRRLLNSNDKGFISESKDSRAIQQLLYSPPKPEIEKDTNKKQIVVRAKGDVLVSSLELEHH